MRALRSPSEGAKDRADCPSRALDAPSPARVSAVLLAPDHAVVADGGAPARPDAHTSTPTAGFQPSLHPLPPNAALAHTPICANSILCLPTIPTTPVLTVAKFAQCGKRSRPSVADAFAQCARDSVGVFYVRGRPMEVGRLVPASAPSIFVPCERPTLFAGCFPCRCQSPRNLHLLRSATANCQRTRRRRGLGNDRKLLSGNLHLQLPRRWLHPLRQPNLPRRHFRRLYRTKARPSSCQSLWRDGLQMSGRHVWQRSGIWTTLSILMCVGSAALVIGIVACISSRPPL
jgi:hypothetical protein